MKSSLEISTPKESRSIEIPLDKNHRDSLATVLAQNGFPLNTRCAQRGLCNGCEIKLEKGTLLVDETIRNAPDTVKACRCHLNENTSASLHIPARSLLQYRPNVATDFRIGIPYAQNPLDSPGDRPQDLSICIDIGTTTVVVALVDPVQGKILGKASTFNQQIHHGDDVLTRIQLCSASAKKVEALQHAVAYETIRPLIHKVCREQSIPPGRIGAATIAGNTTMLHLLLGEDPTPMGIAPFTPRFLDYRKTSAKALGITGDGLEDFPVHLLPGIAAYIGADLSGGIYTTGMLYEEGPCLLVDVGTNGEIVYKHGETFTACATAAGPAFEGAGLSAGTRGVEGAIGKISLRSSPFAIGTEIIGGSRRSQAIGICGSGYIDFLAEARKTGLLGEQGRFEATAWESLPSHHQARGDFGRAIDLHEQSEDVSLFITEVDIAHILQAKAAIAAGIAVLLEKDGVSPSEVKTVYLAGGFGMHLNIPNAITAGLLPGFSAEQIQIVGNTSLAGAYLSLLDRAAIGEMTRLREKIEVIELNLEASFEDHYIDNLCLS